MAEGEASGPAGSGPGAGDPVGDVREWLSRNGVTVPPASAVSTPPAPRPRPEVETGPDDEIAADRSLGSGDPDGDPVSLARTIVLRKLAAQARTRHELAKALASRHVPDDVAEVVLERFEAAGLVDDAAFARDWVESRQQRRHLSKSALRRELQTKGVDRELVDAAVGEIDGEDELAAARALAEKKLRTVDGLPREVQYRRLAGALARRGFSGGITATVVGPLLDGRDGD